MIVDASQNQLGGKLKYIPKSFLFPPMFPINPKRRMRLMRFKPGPRSD
jgi:hypothetical protein